MEFSEIIAVLAISYPLLTYIANKTPWEIDDKIIKILDKLLPFLKKGKNDNSN